MRVSFKKKIIIIILFLSVLFGISIYLYQSNSSNVISANNVVEIPQDEGVISTKSDKVFNLRKQFNNDDVIGNLSIPGTELEEAVMQSGDNDFYLVHDQYGNYDKYGSIFLDYRCNKDSRKLLIFGHSSTRIHTPFGDLEKYYEKSYYNEHKYIDLVIEDELRKYLIFSVYIETSDFTYMNLNIDDEVYAQNLNSYLQKSLYSTGVEVFPTDEILILQTCSNHQDYQGYEDKFLLIIAKRV